MQGKIAVISPSTQLTARVEALLRHRGIPLLLVQASQTTAVALARQLIDDGARVIISRGRTAQLLREQLRVPIVEVRHTFFDCVNAYREARRVSAKVAFLATSQGYLSILQKSKAFLDEVTLCAIDPFDSLATTEAKLDALQAQGIEVAIGGLSLQQAVVARGIHYIMSDADTDAVNDAIDEASHLLQIETERGQKSLELQSRYEMTRSILDCVSEGIFSIDLDGVITNLNSVATAYLGNLAVGDTVHGLIGRDYFTPVLAGGKPLRGGLIKLGRHSLTLSIAPIKLGEQVIGAVATLQTQTEIQHIEQKMRRLLARTHRAERTFDDIIGSSPALARAKALALRYAAVDSTVMIEGETGTGKELFAQSIHNASKRRHAPFVAINCAAFAPSVLESELFGYVKGAFTGALAEGKAGIFELAHTGTILLDEISETSSDIQLKLLRTLQERKVIRMGDDKVTPIDIRIITASNKRLPALVAEGLFREDFYYRICVLKLALPALRERREDIPELLPVLLKGLQLPACHLAPGALARLADYPWPGNIRQLSNIAERLAVMSDDGHVDEALVAETLDDTFPDTTGQAAAAPPLGEQARLLRALANARGNRQQAAQALGISTTTLWRWMKKYGVDGKR